MASKAHAFNHYALHGAVPRPRREVWYQSDDPVVLPRSRRWDFNSVLLAAALTAAGVVVASSYAVFHADPPGLAETPAAPLARDWDADTEQPRANVLNMLSGPAFAAPSIVMPDGAAEQETDTPSAPRGGQSDYVIDDSAPGVQQRLPQPAPITPIEPPYPDPLSKPYPNPTTTPPEAVAPPDVSPQTPTPALDPENPYR